MKSTSNTINRANKANVTKGKFTGEVLLTPICFNPTSEELRKIKNVPEEFDVKTPDYSSVVTIQDVDYKKLYLLCSFNPNEILETDKYQDVVYVYYELFLSDQEIISKNNSSLVIDEHNQNSWVKRDGKKGAKTLVKAAQAEGSGYKEKHPIHKIDANTARFAKIGEIELQQLIFDLSTLDRHNPTSKNPSELIEFKLGENPSETFSHICEGEVSSINKFMGKFNSKPFPGREYFINEKGENNKIGGMLILDINSNDPSIQYQKVLGSSPFYWLTDTHTFRPTDRVNKYEAQGLEESRLKKKTIERLIDEDYAIKSYWGDSLLFTVFDSKKAKEENENVSSEMYSIDSIDEGMDGQTFESDMPF